MLVNCKKEKSNVVLWGYLPAFSPSRFKFSIPPIPGNASNVWDRTLPEVKEADEDLKEEEDEIIADELCICEELIDWDLKEEDIEVAFEPEVMEKPFISFFELFTAVMLLATAMLDCLNDFDSTFVPLLTAHSPASGGV